LKLKVSADAADKLQGFREKKILRRNRMPSILVYELKKDHEAVLGLLEKLRSANIDSKEAQGCLLSIKTALLTHLRKEDTQLYPVLKRAAEKDGNLKQTLNMFAQDMDTVSKTALEFVDKYAHGGDKFSFARDLGKITIAVKTRISKEENILYNKFDQIAA